MITINCPYWDCVESDEGGLCQKSGKTVSFGVCEACLKAKVIIKCDSERDGICTRTGKTCNRQACLKARITERLAICKSCDEFNGNLCELKFDKGVCLCKWQVFLREGKCPKGRF